MTILNLNRANVAALPASDGVWWDTGLKGFGYLQRTSKADGSLMRSFIIQYRFGKIQRKFKLGDASKLNADQTRKLAIKLFGQILDGIDPQVVKEAERTEAAKLTFAEAVAQYLEQKKTENRPASLKLAELYLSGARYFPTLHRNAIDSITRGDIAPHLDRIGSDSGTATAGRARAHLSSLFMWALITLTCIGPDGVAVEKRDDETISEFFRRRREQEALPAATETAKDETPSGSVQSIVRSTPATIRGIMILRSPSD
jgi:hypothetical protein